MKTNHRFQIAFTLIAAIVGIALTTTPSRAAQATASLTAPTVNGADIANLGFPVTLTDKWWNDAKASGATRGQTFTTGSSSVLLKAITYQTSSIAMPTKTYVIRVGTVSGSTFTQIATETATQAFPWNAGEYMTWTFDTPVSLSANTVYAIDVAMLSSTTDWPTGIPYLNTTGNSYAGGAYFTSGGLGVGDSTMNMNASYDRVFHLDLEDPMRPSPESGTTLPVGNVALGWTNLTPVTGTDVWVDVWFGTNPAALTKVVTADPDGLNRTSVTVSAPNAATYYWRVDSYRDGAPTGTPVQGNLFSFIVTPPPTLDGSSIADDKSGGPVLMNTLVTYTVTFSKDMDATTVTAEDFGNAGTAAITFGTITETSPGVFTVKVMPTTAGSLQLQVNAGADLKDAVGNALVTTSAIPDNTTLAILADTTPPTLTEIVDDKSGGTVAVGTVVTYTVSFSEDMDANTVTAEDFGNAVVTGGAGITIGMVSETSVNSGIFTVPVTTTSGGSLQLQVLAGADLKDVAGNALVTTPIPDDTTLIVDGTPPTLMGTSIVDNKSGGPVAVNTVVTYTVTFSEDIDASTVTAEDFGNAGTAAITFGAITETSPGVFSVKVMPTTAGSLQLQVLAGAVISDVAGNPLVTTWAIPDDTTLIIDGTPPTLAGTGIVDDKGGGPVTVGTVVTYTVTFSEDMNASTVSSADFGNAGTAAITFGTITETSATSGVFTVQVTPTSAGSLRLKVLAGASLKDAAGNSMVTTAAIPDDTTLTVNSGDPYATWAGGAAFGADANNDGVANGLAWLLGAANPSANASGLLPKPTNETGKLVLTFRCLKTANRGAAVLKVQYSNNLGQTDPWTSHEAVVPDTDGAVGSVYFDTTADADPKFITVRAEIPASAASAGGKLFGRLYSTGN